MEKVKLSLDRKDVMSLYQLVKKEKYQCETVEERRYYRRIESLLHIKLHEISAPAVEDQFLDAEDELGIYQVDLSSLDDVKNTYRDIMNCPIEDLDFSIRTYNCLKRARIDTVGETMNNLKNESLFQRTGFGRKVLEEITSTFVKLDVMDKNTSDELKLKMSSKLGMKGRIDSAKEEYKERGKKTSGIIKEITK